MGGARWTFRAPHNLPHELYGADRLPGPDRGRASPARGRQKKMLVFVVHPWQLENAIVTQPRGAWLKLQMLPGYEIPPAARASS
jgi:hypothetical protein